MKHAIKSMVERFRILKGWRLSVVQSKEFSGFLNLNANHKEVIIYDWTEPDKPVDFDLHEVLHVALRALLMMDRRKMKELLQAEEVLIQDICNELRRQP